MAEAVAEDEDFEAAEDKVEANKVGAELRQKDIRRITPDGRDLDTLTYRPSTRAGNTGTGGKTPTGVGNPIPAPGRITPRPRIRIEDLTSLTSL